MSTRKRFSARRQYSLGEAEITIREDAPGEVRGAVIAIARESHLNAEQVRDLACRVLRRLPDRYNWSKANVLREAEGLLESCAWYSVYDFAEACYEQLSELDAEDAELYQAELNRFFREHGVGYQMVEGMIEDRGSEAFELEVQTATEKLENDGHSTAARELKEARLDLSRRPTPDVTGAIQHALGALECVAREVSGDARSTLGQLVKRHPGLFPTPLDTAVEKAWGYASEVARHVREGGTPTAAEARFVVGFVAVLADSLVNRDDPTPK
jgi:hypothetical protein